MTNFPKTAPQITVQKHLSPPFPLTCEEIPGFFIIPRVGEKATFAFYDNPAHVLTGIHTLRCTHEAEIHGITCVLVENNYQDTDGNTTQTTNFIRRTETHISHIAQMSTQNGLFQFSSFLDDGFLENYGFGDDNIGSEIAQITKGVVTLVTDSKFSVAKHECQDIFGRYNVTIGMQCYDTVAMLTLWEEGIATIIYLDKNGRTVLFRRYNRIDWSYGRYGENWEEKLPNSEVIYINAEKYVHWYDCIGDYSLSL